MAPARTITKEMVEHAAFGVAHMTTGGSNATARKISGEPFAEPSPGRKGIPA